MSNFNKINVSDEIKILFNKDEIILNRLNKTQFLCNEFCSDPQLSPSKKMIAFISPYEWECIGDLYIYNLIDDEMKVFGKEKLPEQSSIKSLKWLDEENLLMIIGLAYGTVSVGGNLYLYNHRTDSFKLIIQKCEKEEIKDFCISGNRVKLEVVKFNDDYTNYNVNFEETYI